MAQQFMAQLLEAEEVLPKNVLMRLAVPASVAFVPFSEGPALRARKTVVFERSRKAR